MAHIFISHSSRDGKQAESMRAWVHEQGFAETFLDFDKHSGLPPGSDWERTLYREITKAEAVILILTRNWFESKWCFAEFTQARALGKAIFPVIEEPRAETWVSPDIQHLDLVEDREGGLKRLATELDQIATELEQIALNERRGFDWDPSRPPYPGLLYFDEADAAIYFGRDDYIRRLIERLNARRANGGKKLIVVLGASGSGKSSLLRAGVVPRLKRDKRNWIVPPPFRPQFHPIDELAQALAAELGPSGNWRACRKAFVAKDLTEALSDLARDLRAAHSASEAQILITIDQAEELFGVAQETEGEHFLSILDVLLDERLPFLVVVGLRSDYLGRLQQSGLKAPFEEFSLKPMPLERVRDIIKGPARVAEFEVDDELIMAAMRDAATDDALPLLAFALRELYDRFGRSGRLTVEHYRALGDDNAQLSPLENAVRQKAEQVMSAAKPAVQDQEALKEAFVGAMVRVNAEGEYVRRPAAMDALPARARPLIDQLSKARLLIVRGEGNSAIVEVAHEALLRKWPLLRSWLDKEREFLIGKDQIEQDLRDWEKAATQQKTQALLSGLKLTRAEAWLLEHPQALTEAESKFIKASIAFRDAAAARRALFRRVLLVGSVAATIVFGWLYRNAKSEQSRFLASLSQQETGTGDATNGMLRALEALGEKPSVHLSARSTADESENSTNLLEEIASYLREAIAPYLYDRSPVSDAGKALFAAVQESREEMDLPGCPAAFSSGGDRVVVAAGNAVQVWDAESGHRLGISPRHNGSVYSVAFSPHDDRIVTAFDDGTAQLWDVASGQQFSLHGHKGAVYAAAFNVKRDQIVTASDDTTSRLWDISTAENLKAGTAALSLGPIAVLHGHKKLVRWAEFSPDGNRIVTASDDGTARVWDLSKAQILNAGAAPPSLNPTRVIQVLKDVGSVFSARFNFDGTRIVTASSDGKAQVWNATTFSQVCELKGHDGPVRSASFDLHGNRVVTASDDWTARVWKLTSCSSALVLKGHNAGVRSAAFSPDGSRIVTASDDHTARVWDADSGDSLLVLAGHSDSVYSAQFSSNGRSILTASEDGTTRLWSATPGPPRLALHGHIQKINSAAFSLDAKRIITTSDDGNARLWDAETGRSQTLQSNAGPVASAAFSPSDRIVTVSNNGTVAVWNVANGIDKLPPPLRTKSFGAVSSVAFSRDGSRLVVVSNDVSASASLYDVATGSSLVLPVKGILKVAFSRGGDHIVTGSADGSVNVWDAKSGRSLMPTARHGGAVNSVGFSSTDGKSIVTASDDGTARVWDAASGVNRMQLNDHLGAVVFASFSGNDSRIVTDSVDAKEVHTVRIWDAASGQVVSTLPGVSLLGLSPDGSWMLIRFDDDTAKVVDVVSGNPVAVITGKSSFGAFSPDASKLVMLSEKPFTASVWQLFPTLQSLVKSANDNLPRHYSTVPHNNAFTDLGISLRRTAALPACAQIGIDRTISYGRPPPQ